MATSDDVDQLTARLAGALGGPADGAADVVIDPVFGSAATAASRNLADGGRLVNLGSASNVNATFTSALLRSRSIEILGYTNNALSAVQRANALTTVMAHAAGGALHVDHDVLSLEQVSDAC